MQKSFKSFLDQLKTTNSTLDFFVDFKKITKNVDEISIKLNQLNYLLGQDNLEYAINRLFDENKNCFSVLNILIAVRENRLVLDDSGNVVLLFNYFETATSVLEFLEKTGLADIFRTKKVKNLVDYVFGIEVGLDTNARKNRGGENMSKAVSIIFDKSNILYTREVNSTEFPEITSLGADLKRFDFVVKTKVKTYLIETNFYNGGGSKLNEVARAYSDVAPKINQYANFEFVWITDGQGWLSAKNKLEEAFSIIPSVYNLKTISEFINKIQKELCL